MRIFHCVRMRFLFDSVNEQKQILHKKRTRIRETGAFSEGKGQRPARPYIEILLS